MVKSEIGIWLHNLVNDYNPGYIFLVNYIFHFVHTEIEWECRHWPGMPEGHGLTWYIKVSVTAIEENISSTGWALYDLCLGIVR